jgi:cytochrome c553
MLKALLAYFFVVGAVASAALIAAPARAQNDPAARAQLCAACHGVDGKPVSAIMPIIWGQQSNYLYKQLHDYHSGQRFNAIMAPLVKTIDLPDLRKLADYFAAKTWPAQQTNVAVAATPPSATMCKACHGQNFEGTQAAPRLAGQTYDYLVAAMDSFANAQRTNNLDMPGFMSALTEDQRQAIAHYLSAL